MTSKEKAAFRRTQQWKEFRKSFLADHPTCAICGRKANIVHHIFVSKDEASYTNLDHLRFCALDNKCHQWIHKLNKNFIVDQRILDVLNEIITTN